MALEVDFDADFGRPWKMYPLGVLFGLGFDTSSEVALLGISSLQGSQGTSIWLILIFPILFTAGMCMLDTTDGALMMSLYTSTSFAKDPIAILYYSIVLTMVTIAAAMTIGVIQLLTLILNTANPTGPFWDGVANAGDHYDIIGGGICGSFVVFGVTSVVLYKPWRRWVNGKALGSALDEEDASGELCGVLEGGFGGVVEATDDSGNGANEESSTINDDKKVNTTMKVIAVEDAAGPSQP